MNRRIGVVAAFALGSASLQGLAVQQQAPTTFRARTDVVSVNVSVKDGRRPVVGLSAADFELLDNGVRQTIEAASLEKMSIDVTLVLTGWDSARADAHLTGLVSASEVRALLTPVDRLRVVTVGDGVQGGLVGPGFAVATSHERSRQIPGISLIDGLFYALAWPVEIDRRHLVVAFTDGDDSWSTLEAERLPAIASHSDAVFHAVFWKTPNDVQRVSMGATGADAVRPFSGKPQMGSAFVREWERGYRAVIGAVDRTGGTYRPTSAAGDAFKAILDDFRTSYVLRYSPHGVAGKGWHELRVRVTRRGSFTVRSRKGYEGG